MDRQLTIVSLTAGAFLALHVILPYWRPHCLWGLDMLAYLPGWAWWAFAISGASLLVLPVRRLLREAAGMLPSSLSPWNSPRSFHIGSVLVALLSLLAFLYLRSAAHLLGDGQLLSRELGASIWQQVPRLDRAPLTFWLVESLNDLAASIGWSAEGTYRACSYTSGLIYVVLSFRIARAAGPDATARTIVLGFLLTPGFIQLFFGYVENYPLLLSGILLYLLLSLLVIKGRQALWVPSALLGALVPLHFAAAALAPSLLVLAELQRRSSSGVPRVAFSLSAARILAQLVVAPLAALLVFGLIQFDIFGYLTDLRGSHFLPLASDPGNPDRYGLFSAVHLFDVLNQLLLVAPAALITLALAWRSARSSDPYRTFLLAAAAFPLFFTFAANPEIGAFRDWDVFAFAGLPLTLWSALILIDRIPDRGQLCHAGLLICGTALLHSVSWVSVNAYAAPAEARFAHLLRHCHLSRHARAYGWETLGIRYYREREPVRAIQAYEEAISANPDNARYHSNLGNLHLALGHFDAALDAHSQALRLAPDLGQTHLNMGAVYYRMGRFGDAVGHYRQATTVKPDYAEAFYGLGTSCNRLGRSEEAIKHYQRAVELDPTHARAYVSMADAYSNLGRLDSAIDAYRTAIRTDPGFVSAHLNAGIAYRDLGQTDSARASLTRVLQLDPDHSQAAAIRNWLQAHP